MYFVLFAKLNEFLNGKGFQNNEELRDDTSFVNRLEKQQKDDGHEIQTFLTEYDKCFKKL